ncbi:hypothetical protein BDR22DRAFT_823262 [Usnea florida]
MHTSLAFGAWGLIPLLCMVAGKPVPGTLLSPSTTANEIQPRQVSNQPLTLVSPSINGSYLTLPHGLNDIPPTKQSNATVEFPEGFIPYRVPHSPVTLFFHDFGTRVPTTTYILDALGLSLARVLKITAAGKGRDPILRGFFLHKHVFPNNDNVTITVADFREVGRLMDYSALRDALVGMRNFLREQGRRPTTVAYEVEVDGMGYVGTGHIDYEFAGGKDVGVS